MSWKELLGEKDFLTFQTNAALLVERVAERFVRGEAGRDILEAIRRVPRHRFVGESYRSLAYTDEAIPAIEGLTTSARSVIAEMIFLSGVRPGDRALEIGTGTGYQTAVLAEMGVRVHSIEINEELAVRANQSLVALGYKHDKTAEGPRGVASLSRYHTISREFRYRGIVDLYLGNGLGGLPEFAPFHAIIVSAAVARLDPLAKLIDQLAPEGGRLVAPVGGRTSQKLRVAEKRSGRIEVSKAPGGEVSFVPAIL